jgi:hypothetical protein
MAGRSTPASIPSRNMAVAMQAPVFPALTNPAASPRFTRSMATSIEESFFLRSATDGDSSMPTASEACLTQIGRPSAG